ncbi:MAG: hypothetical protein IPK53_12990 [bacterium]|nr:hypothetical protein [bacterium]
MKVLSIVVVFLAGVCIAVAQSHSITAAEYFFDADPGQGNGTPIAVVANDVIALDGDVSTAGLDVGPHVLNVRVRRDDGRWGEPTRRVIRVGIGTQMSAAEAYFDNDPGIGSAIPVSISPLGMVDLTDWDVPPLTRGFHTFNLRCYSGGTWSAPETSTIRIGSALIDGAEVYFDSDPGQGNGIPVDIASGADVIAYDSTVQVAATGQGKHSLYLRFRGGGVWSFTTERPLRIGLPINGGMNRISAGEFYVDSDPGIGNGCELLAEDGVFDEGEETMRRYVAADLTLGQHVIGMRVRDAGDRWHDALTDSVTVVTSHLLATTQGVVGDAQVLLMWTKYPEALSYHVHYDSLETGPFSSYITVLPPDTSLLLAPTQPKRLYYVVALETSPEPCDAAITSDQNISQ